MTKKKTQKKATKIKQPKMTAPTVVGKYVLTSSERIDAFGDVGPSSKDLVLDEAQLLIESSLIDSCFTKAEVTKGIRVFRITAVEEVDLIKYVTRAVETAEKEQEQALTDPYAYQWVD